MTSTAGSNELAGTVSVIDTRTNQVIGSPITVGNAPAGLAASGWVEDVIVRFVRPADPPFRPWRRSVGERGQWWSRSAPASRCRRQPRRGPGICSRARVDTPSGA
ncbi:MULTISPECIES: hypothetical protein [unclassified Streptomyces]|uniref:hypothetical protein n=1 Tax=unclassified Streptomyces TaxID=2593676 RepID=UPI00338F269B